MPFFNVIVHAPCLAKASPNGPHHRGFYVPYFLRAASPETAVAEALAALAVSEKAQRIAASFDSPMPTLEVEGVTAMPWYRYVWYRYVGEQPGWVVYDESNPDPADERVA